MAVVGHYDGVGNPVDEKTRRQHIVQAIKTVESWGSGLSDSGLTSIGR
ncbi:MAG: carbonic anhydrase [candidate division WOR-3 bacterium]